MEIFTQNITVQNIKEVRNFYVQNNHSTKSSNSREGMLVSVLQKTKTKKTGKNIQGKNQMVSSPDISQTTD